MTVKRIALAVMVAAAFLVGFAGAAEAWPIKGRNQHFGYFRNIHDAWGDHVWMPNTGPADCRGTGLAIPTGVNTRGEFVDFVMCKLNRGNNQERVGAAFIIQTMRGDAKTCTNSVCRPTDAQIADWEARVRNPAMPVDWGSNTQFRSYTINSYYQGVTGGGPGGQANPVDNAFYNDSDSSNYTIVFGSGSNSYVLRRQCANPVGNGSVGVLPPAPNYTMAGHTTIQNSTTGQTSSGNMSVEPGERVRFRHYLTNNGPGATTPTTINWSVHNMPGGSQVSSGNNGTFNSGQQKNSHNESYFTVPIGTAPGTEYCRQIRFNPRTQAGGSGTGTTRCVLVVAAQDYYPQASVSSATAQEGDTVTFTFRIENRGTNSSPVTCVINGTQPPGVPGPPAVPSGCPPGSFPPNSTTQLSVQQDISVEGQAPGTRICRSLTVSPASPTVGSRTSPEACVTVVKTPYVRFMGNDVWAGGGFADPCTSDAAIVTSANQLSDGSMAGSVVEYQAFAMNRVTDFGSSGRVLTGGMGTVGSAARQLTFANNQASGLGYFGQPKCLNDYAGYSLTSLSPNPGAVDVGTRGSGQWRYSGDLNLSGALQPGAQQVYYVDGNVTISGPITYPGTYSSISEIPSILVVANGNVRVQANVNQLDGMYVAVGDGDSDGVFYTCWPRTEPASVTNACDAAQLVVNGTVIAGRIDLFRSFGAAGGTPTDRQEPGELFQFSPEVYLRNVINSTGQTTIQTTNITELPPRF